MRGGYTGKYLDINLTTGQIEKKEVDEKMIQEYVGGGGFSARILWDETSQSTDPLGPESPLIIMTGPLTGTLAPTGNCWYVGFKAPTTGIYGEGRGGGYWGPELKYAGYDYMIIRGKAEKPVYLNIHNDQVSLEDAAHLWGKDFFDTTYALEEAHPGAKVMGIGPAGENLVKSAIIMSDLYRAGGRGGAGAVMGAKNLKAIAVYGSKGVQVADPEGFKEILEEVNKVIYEHPATAQLLPNYGTASLVNGMNAFGALPTRNHRSGTFEGAEKISGEAMAESILVKTRSCFACNIKCTRYTKVDKGEYAGVESEGPEYETVNAFGSRCGVDNLEAIAMANMNANRLGLDTISAGTMIAFAMELFEEGILTKEECNGLDLTFGNHQAMNTLLQDLAHRKGLGDTLAEGVRAAAKKIGKGAEKYAMHVKGLELTATELRAAQDSGLGHAIANRGGDHLRPWSPAFTLFGFGQAEIDLSGTPDPIVPEDKARVVKAMEKAAIFTDLNGMCKFTVLCNTLSPAQLARLTETVTGLPMDVARLEETVDRALTLQRALNLYRYGMDPSLDTLPDRFTKDPAPDGPAKGKVCELPFMLQDYYEKSGWDTKGYPTDERYDTLGLAFVKEQR
ncbi:aldehyde ferredoxin oxidoreductase family protein [Anoxynatronum sibiricum]|uniref:Aldehyde ferredoxin oxidoreductase family protein n=1 Tax=Anoxynatronum sibiricum TaxID=210623 RepID=A0ABU9VPS9_9CLOT